jgi:malate dehydrogenase (oxaloacetate-decarboxylating)(NADP+)
MKIKLTGMELLNSAAQTKGTAFTEEERKALKIEGLLPTNVETLELQIKRIKEQLALKPNDLERYVYLQELSARNTELFFAVVMSDPAYYIPIVYDPTIADACLTYGEGYRRPQGMYLNKHMKGRIAEVLENWPIKNIRFICISSGGRILGLGDIGANGAPIPIGKLQLYTACAGVPPHVLLPIHFDIGTTNKQCLADPLYTGLHETPLTPNEIDALVDEFVQAAQKVFPGVCIHFEDWKGEDAIRLLKRYCENNLVFNDDIQGTASIALAGLTTAMQILGQKFKEQRVLMAGAGSAGIGIANMLTSAMVLEGLTLEEARQHIVLYDVNGLIESARTDLNPSQQVYAQTLTPTRDLVKAIEEFKPTIIIGVSTVGGLFTEQVVRTMAKINKRPVIFALSNPTQKAECSAQQAYEWTDGQVLFAAGVQFPNVSYKGQEFYPGQANNFYIYPAMGLAVYATKAKRINDAMFVAAAAGCASIIAPEQRAKGLLYPLQSNILEVEISIATAIAKNIFDQKLASVDCPADIHAWLESLVYKPSY